MAISQILRRRLEMRGIACSSDPEFVKVVPWMRFTFVICGTLIGVATALASVPFLLVMAPIAALGAVFPRHPFDLIYNHGVRHLTGTQPLPLNGTPTRFSCGVASVWLVATALVFALGPAWLGYTLGGALTSVGVIVSVTQLCLASMVYQLLFGDRSLIFGTPQSERQPEGG